MKANLPKREPEMLKRWDGIKLYELMLRARKDAQAWVLHDGPPYANGRVHFGTALNKILKDFIVRSRSMMGMRAPFVPGWDCHGMPIELGVVRELGEKARTMPKLELRRLCRAAAERWIDIQRADFRRLGAIGDWADPYLTFAPGYDAAEIGVLRKLVEDGYVYRGLRPVHWCFDCRTALAEAEVEYRDHASASIYVAFAVNEKLTDAAALAADPADGSTLAEVHRAGRLFAVIWTTTPWTLPANLGICLNSSFEYVALRSGDRWYIVAARLADRVAEAGGLKVEARIDLAGDALRALGGQDIFRHPFAARDVKLMFGDHVTADAGTGLVHTAPGHGYEDFVVGEEYGLPTLTPVDNAGVFTSEAGKYAGRNVFETNDAIVNDLRESGALLHGDTIGHSYPHCWRCKNPLIFRATEQWFMRIDHDGLRERMLGEIDGVRWVPPWSRDRIRNMVETRPDWCLSRQRVWGVPIPALKCAGCATVTLDPEVLKRVEEVFAREGSDSWYSHAVGDFLPDGYRCRQCGGAELAKEEDVLDVWFDSGCSHAAVLAMRPELKWPADAYVEGIDQARGWFQVSLITSTATRAHAPYKSVVTHGLALDELGRKMSKSLGNAEDALDVVNRIGADVFRLVFASVDYASDMNVGENLFTAVSEAYRKLRNTCRYILGNLGDFDPARDATPVKKMAEIDRFILARAERLKQQVYKAYDDYDFQTAYHAIINFVVIDLSSLYIDVARDRLYCSATASAERRSVQTALYGVIDTLVRMLAPLIPYTADEIYGHIPGRTADSVHLLEFVPPDPQWADAGLDSRWDGLLAVRTEVLKLLERMRQDGVIGAPLEASVAIYPGLKPEQPQVSSGPFADDADVLRELLIVSNLDFLDEEQARQYRDQAAEREDFTVDGRFVRCKPPLVVVGNRAPGRKCQRCWIYYDDDADPELCPRCRSVVRKPAA